MNRTDTRRHTLPVLLFTVFLDLLGFGLLIPVIPQLLANPSSPFYLLPATASVSYGYLLVGILLACFPAAQFFAAPVLGQWSDTRGRRRVLLVSLAGTSVSYALFAIGVLTRNLPLLFVSRVLAGATGGNVAAAQAAIADVTAPKDRAKNFGLVGAAVGLGFIVGPFIGGILSDPSIVPWFDATTPFWFAALLGLLNVASVALFFRETLKSAKAAVETRWYESLLNIKKAWGLRPLRPLFGSMFLFNMGLSFIITFLGVFLVARFGFSQGSTGIYFAFVGLCIALSQAVLPHFLSKYFGERRVLQVALLSSGLGILLIFLVPNQTVLWAATPVFSALIGLAQANAVSLISRSARAEVQGEILGINASLQALSQAIPPILSGLAAAALSPESPVLIAALFLLASGVLFITVAREKT